MEEIIKDFLISQEICKNRQKIQIINEYRADVYPQVYKVIDELNNIIFKIRVTTNRKNAVNTEKIVCNILKKNKCEKFYPQIYKEFRDQPILGNVLIMEYIKGHTLAYELDRLSTKEEQLIINSLYSIVQNIHSIKSKYFTIFDEIKFGSWIDFFHYRIQEFIEYSYKEGLLDLYLVRTIKEIVDTFKFRNDFLPTLVYYDLKPDNIIIDIESNTVSLVDYEIARFVDPYMEVSKGEFLCYLFHNDRYKNNIWIPLAEKMLGKEYNNVISDKKIKLYTIYHHLSYLNHIWKLENKVETASLLKIEQEIGEV